MSEYKWSYLIGDITAGLTLASFQIPLSISYASSLAHVDTHCGLWGLIIPPFIYSLFGSVPVMVVGPEASLSLVVGQTVAPYLHDDNPGITSSDPSRLTTTVIASLITATVGLVVLALGLMRAGFLESIVPPSLLRGFISGVGLVMITDQIPSQLGLADKMHKELPPDASSFHKLMFSFHHYKKAHRLETTFSICGIIAIITLKVIKSKLSKKRKWVALFPDILVVVIFSGFITWWGSFAEKGLQVIGNVDATGISFDWMLRPKYFKDFRLNFSSSFFVAVLGFLESTVASRALGRGDLNVSANRELVALGLANLVGSLFEALPSFGGYGRSKINKMSGARTQLSSMVIAAVTLFTVYFLMGYLYYVPKCILSCIVASVGVSLVEEAPTDILFFLRVKGWNDLVTITISSLATFFWSVEAGVTIGVFYALIRVIHHATRPRIQILTKHADTREWVNADEMRLEGPDADEVEAFPINSGTLVVKIPEPLTFANCGDLGNRLQRLERHRTVKAHPAQPATDTELHYIIFDLKGMTSCDASATRSLLRIVRHYVEKGVKVLFAETPNTSNVRERLFESGIANLVNEANNGNAFYDSIDKALMTFDPSSATSLASSVQSNFKPSSSR